MEDLKLRCPSCRHQMPAEPPRCPECGAKMEFARTRWSAPPWLVIFLLFFVLGPLALGILWRNDRFSLTAKWVLTLLVILYTAAGCWYVHAVFQKVMRQAEEITNQIQMF